MMANLSGRKCIGVPGPWGEKEARQSERINKNVFWEEISNYSIFNDNIWSEQDANNDFDAQPLVC